MHHLPMISQSVLRCSESAKANCVKIALILRWSIVLIPVALAPVLEAQLYSAVKLSPTGNVIAYDINNSGTVAGTDGAQAFSYKEGAFTNLGSLGGSWSYGRGINDAATVVGFSSRGNSSPIAFSYSDGKMTALTPAGVDVNSPFYSSIAYSINNPGTIVGSATLPGGSTRHAFSYTDGIMTDLGALGDVYSDAYGINDAGTVVGGTFLESGYFGHAFYYSNNVMTDLGTLGGTNSIAFHINNAGTVVGAAALSDDRTRHAFSYNSGIMTDLGSFWEPSQSVARDINNSGTIVGSSAVDFKFSHAFIYNNGVMTDLNALVDLPGIRLDDALAINDAGQIVAIGNSFTFLLTPIAVPEPATYLFAFTWLSLVAVLIGRRRFFSPRG